MEKKTGNAFQSDERSDGQGRPPRQNSCRIQMCLLDGMGEPVKESAAGGRVPTTQHPRAVSHLHEHHLISFV